MEAVDMKLGGHNWSRLGITGKFSLAFTLMLVFQILITTTGYFSLVYIGKAEQRIRKSSAIEQLVLKMDQGLEKARRLQGNFFLKYQSIGLQAAHEEYAQPSVGEIAMVIMLSSKLKKLLFQSETDNLAEIDRTDVNLYLSLAERYAETSIEAVELISQRATPEKGVETQLKAVSRSLEKELKTVPDLWSTFIQADSSYKEYLASRQRFVMQSALNVLGELRLAVESETSFVSERKSTILGLVNTYEKLAVNLLDIDLAISGKLRDFNLQEKTVSPLSQKLIQLTQKEVQLAEYQIDHVHRMAAIIMLTTSLFAAFAVLYIARLMHYSITKRVLGLTTAAGEFSQGKLDVRVEEKGHDELGQLGIIFNKMAARLHDLVENLEKKVEQRTAELSASEQQFRHLLNDLPKIAVQGYDSERKAVYWNHASETLYGYSKDEAMGRKLEDLIIPDHMRENLIHAVQQWHNQDIAISATELTLRNKEGGNVPVYSSHVMQTNYQGEKTMYCIDIDLAELRLAQAEGRKSEFFYRQLFAHSTSGVAVYEATDDGQDFIFKDVNQAGEMIDRINREKVIGRSVTELFPGIKEYGLLQVFRKVWRTGEPEYHPVSFYKDDRLEGWRENRVYKMSTGEIVSVYNDITTQKQAEWDKQNMELQLQRAQKMEAIGLLAGSVAHDLNNILSAVVGYPELLLLDLPEDSKLRQPLEATKEAGERATAVVADLLTVARGVASVKEPKDLNVLVREYMGSPEFLKLQSHHPSVQFKRQLAAALPAILCSPVHVKKSIMNVVTNGAEAIEDSGTVTIATKSHFPEQKWAQEHGLELGEYVILSITDTGSGIQEKDLEHIFEPFYTKKVMGHQSGTGLGLSVVWNALQDHQGTVVVSSSVGTTTFELYFPATSETIAAIDKRGRDLHLQGKGEKVLVVDDEPQQRNLAGKMLELLGYQVICQESGEKAVAYIQDHQVDLVLLDMLMDPGINGRETYQRMIEIHPGLKAIIASGFSESDEVTAALAMGAGGFIQKPYSIDQLGQMVKAALYK
jgi:PAS domain S-box-containing protein